MAYVFNPRTDVDITGLEWWEVLQRLHQATRAIGPFAMNRPLTDAAAMELITRYIASDYDGSTFDCVLGRPMNIGFHTRHGQSWVRDINMYDRDAPTPGKVTIAKLRAEKGRRWRELEENRR